MGREASKAAGNVWFEARKKAANVNERLSSRAGAAEELGMSESSLRDAENNLYKCFPVENAVRMADLYNAPHLLNYYCLHECPIGCNRALSAEVNCLERVTVKLLKDLRVDQLSEIKEQLIDIAADGAISEDERPAMQEIMDYLDELSKTISELKTAAQIALKRGK